MKNSIITLLLILTVNISYANIEQANIQASQLQITQPQNIAFENCSKMFAINKEKLFYLTLSAITENKFSIDEIQSENGYIATIAGIDATNSILKITPCNNIYFFAPGILLNMFKYIEINLNTEIR